DGVAVPDDGMRGDRLAQEPPGDDLARRDGQVEVTSPDDLTNEREPVGMQARAGQPYDRVACPRLAAVQPSFALDDADAEAGQVELVGLHHARVLSGLSPDQRAPSLAAALRDPTHDLGGPLWYEAANRQ